MKRSRKLPAPNDGPLPPLGEVFEFMRLLWALDHGVRLASVRVAGRLGLAYPHVLALRILGRFPGLAPGQLARILHLHPSSVSATLHLLVRRGLVRRWPDPRDHRRVLLGLTAKGRELDAPRDDSIESVVTRTLRRLPEARVGAAREVMEALVEALGTANAA